jgi:hypothetical protein
MKSSEEKEGKENTQGKRKIVDRKELKLEIKK